MSEGTGSQSRGLAILRVVVGIVFFAHGTQKLFVFGFHGVGGLFASLHIPLPSVAAVVVTLVEFLGGLALIAGLATRAFAILIAIDMLGAIVFVHARNGFFAQKGGYEFPLTLLAASLCLVLSGAGAASIDGLLGKRA